MNKNDNQWVTRIERCQARVKYLKVISEYIEYTRTCKLSNNKKSHLYLFSNSVVERTLPWKSQIPYNNTGPWNVNYFVNFLISSQLKKQRSQWINKRRISLYKEKNRKKKCISGYITRPLIIFFNNFAR